MVPNLFNNEGGYQANCQDYEELKFFNERIRETVVYARQNPAGYKQRLSSYTKLGYLINYSLILLIIGMLLLTVVFSAITRSLNLVCMIFLPIILAVSIILNLKLLKVKADYPVGIRVNKGKVPQTLTKEVEELRKNLKSPDISEYIFTYKPEIFISDVSKLGFFGSYKKCLTIGLPVMQGLTSEEFRSLLAHEIALASKSHGIAGKSFFLRKVWYELTEKLASRGGIFSRILGVIFKRYFSFYSDYSFAQARNLIFEADDMTIKVVARRVLADALIKKSIITEYLNQIYWPEYAKKAINKEESAENAIQKMLGAIQHNITEMHSNIFMAIAVAKKGGPDEVEPALAERLAHIECEIRLPLPTTTIAAKYYLEDNYNSIVSSINQLWKEDKEADWIKQYDYYINLKKELALLEEKEDLSSENIWFYANSCEELDYDATALPIYEEMLELSPRDALANLSAGKILLKENKRIGVYLVNQAMKLDDELSKEGCKALYEYYYTNMIKEEREYYYNKYTEQLQYYYSSEIEREYVSLDDELSFHNIPLEFIKYSTERFKEIPGIERIYLVRKKVYYNTKKPLYIMGINIIEPKKNSLSAIEINTNILSIISKEILANYKLEGTVKCIILNYSKGDNELLERKIRKIEHSLIYIKGKEIDFGYYNFLQNETEAVLPREEDYIDYYKLEKMLNYQNELLKEKESRLGENHPDVAGIYDEIGKTYRDKGDLYNAVNNYEKALTIFKSTEGKVHPAIAATYNNLAAVYVRMQDYDYAIKLYNEAIELVSKSFGESNQFLAVIYNNIGEVHKKREDYNKALEYYNKSYEIKTTIFGKSHATTIATFENIKKMSRLKKLNS